MKGECPKCGNGKVMTIWPVATETRSTANKNGKLKARCFDHAHEFEIVLPQDPEQLTKLLNEAFPQR